MSASFNLTLDTQAPASPGMLINGGAAHTGDRAVWVALTTADFETGANDVSQMKIWGDVDPAADPAIGTEEAAATWIAYAEAVAVLLSAGSGRKTLYARLRDDVGNETLPFTDFIDLDLDLPVVTVTGAVDRQRISKVSPYDTATFTWESNAPFLAYEVRVVPTHGSPQQAGVVVGTAHGSVRTRGTDRVEAGQSMVTTITGADLEAASPGSTAKVLKVFVRGLSGDWSA